MGIFPQWSQDPGQILHKGSFGAQQWLHQCLLKGRPLGFGGSCQLQADPAHGNQLSKDGKETPKLRHKAAICYRELLLIFS